MRPLTLDYIRTDPLPRRLGIGLLLGGLGTVLVLVLQYRTVAAETARWDARTATLEKATGPARQAGRHAGAELLQTGIDIRHANEVVGQLNVPWDALFQAVESADSDQVALLSIEPDAQKQVVKIGGEAKNLAAMLDYVRQLGQQAVFDRVYLQSHQVQQQDPEKPVRFMVLATWQS